MVIDIDSFLDNFDSNDKKKNAEVKINLDFQKEVEENLDKVVKKSNNNDFNFLKKVYSEVKNFDLDLDNKFLGINSKTDLVLKELGDNYSNEFLLKLKNNLSILKKSLDSNLEFIKNYIKENNFGKSLELLSLILKDFSFFPNEFMLDKIDYSNKIRLLKIEIDEKIIEFKKNNLLKMKIDIKSQLINLNNNLVSGNKKLISDLISKLTYSLNKIPKIFISDLSKEKIYVEKTIIKAEKFIKNEYIREFDEKKETINNLFDKFQTNYLNSSIDEVLLVYDELLFQFRSLPDTNLEDKINIYKEINLLYSKISNLLIKKQVSSFMQSYTSSKIIEEAREYLKHCNLRKEADINNIVLIKSKLEKLPERYNYEKEFLLEKINGFINKKNREIPFVPEINLINKEKKEILTKVKKELDDNKLNNENENKTILKNSNSFENKKVESIIISNSENKNNIKKEKKIGSKKVDNINKNTKYKILQEINSYFDKIRKSNNPKDLKIFYKKILFYLGLLSLKNKEKNEIILKVRKELVNKNLSN